MSSYWASSNRDSFWDLGLVLLRVSAVHSHQFLWTGTSIAAWPYYMGMALFHSRVLYLPASDIASNHITSYSNHFTLTGRLETFVAWTVNLRWRWQLGNVFWSPWRCLENPIAMEVFPALAFRAGGGNIGFLCFPLYVPAIPVFLWFSERCHFHCSWSHGSSLPCDANPMPREI